MNDACNRSRCCVHLCVIARPPARVHRCSSQLARQPITCAAPRCHRDALAAAQMLNRTLVLPTSWCWCDYDWTPHVLERCKIRWVG